MVPRIGLFRTPSAVTNGLGSVLGRCNYRGGICLPASGLWSISTSDRHPLVPVFVPVSARIETRPERKIPMHNSEPVSDAAYRGLRIMSGRRGLVPLWSDMLDGLFDVFSCGRCIHPASRLVRFDLGFGRHFGWGLDDTALAGLVHEVTERFCNSLVHNLGGKRRGVLFAWRRSQKPDARLPHWHFVLLVDASILSLDHVLEVAERLWLSGAERCGGPGVFHRCCHDRFGERQGNGMVIPWRTDQEEEMLNMAYRWASYLCKVEDTVIPPKAHEFGCSQVWRYME